MATLTVRISDSKHDRLKALAQYKKMSMNKLFDELSTVALTEFDAETRFRTLAAAGDIDKGLKILDELDAHFNSA